MPWTGTCWHSDSKTHRARERREIPGQLGGGAEDGFFLDQRENRELVSRYAAGRTVLNTFCYTGGFSVYALAGGREGCSVDSSERAVALADENVRLNFGTEADTRPWQPMPSSTSKT